MRMPLRTTLLLLPAFCLGLLAAPAEAARAARCQVVVSGTPIVVATDDELSAAMDATVTLTHAEANTARAPTSIATGPGSDAPGSAATCGWQGSPLPTPGVLAKYDVQVEISVVPYATVPLAQQEFAAERANSQGNTQPVSGIGDQAFLRLPGDIDATLDVQVGVYDLSVTVSADAQIFGRDPWLAVAKVIIGHLVPSPAAVTVSCTPDAQPGGDSADGSAVARDQINTPGSNSEDTDNKVTAALSALKAHATDPAYLVGFFNTVAPSRVIDWLGIDVNGDALDPLVPDATSDWFYKVFDTALSTCEVSHEFATEFLSKFVFVTPVLRYISRDREASRGLLIHLSASELLTTFADSHLPKPQYTLLYGSALTADDEVIALLPPGVAALPGSSPAHFTRDQAAALTYVSAFTRDGTDLLTRAVASYAVAHLPAAPAPLDPTDR